MTWSLKTRGLEWSTTFLFAPINQEDNEADAEHWHASDPLELTGRAAQSTGFGGAEEPSTRSWGAFGVSHETSCRWDPGDDSTLADR